MPIFGNPLGFLALAAIPAILAIHFLQRESRHVVVSTLFLLEHLELESAQGRRFQRLRSSVPLWLQLLAAFILTWLLVQPRWIRPDVAQHVAIVLDSTVSMRAFRSEMLRAVDEDTAGLARAALHTEWHLLESDTTRPTLYSGPSRRALLGALAAWKPDLGTHDPGPQLEAAQNLLGGRGTLIFVSDRRRELPAGVRLLAVGHPFDHCGFAGLTLQGAQWRVLVKNNGRDAARRQWWIEAAGQRSASHNLAIGPDGTAELSGAFPPGVDRCELVMDADSFPLDSRLPMLLPRRKGLSVRTGAAPPEFADFFRQFLLTLEGVNPAALGNPVDLELAMYDPFAPHLPAGPAIVFTSDPTPNAGFLPGSVTAAGESLASGLNWAGLLVRDNLGVPARPEDETLVWQGNRPLLLLRRNGPASLLVVNFDLRSSNASRLPAFILLLHRFAEATRAAQVAPEADNFETNQLLALAADPHLPPPAQADALDLLRAPAEPRFFRVAQGSRELLDGAAHFADARAADFRTAATIDEVRGATVEALRRNSEADLFAPAWMLAMGLAMVVSWGWRRT